MYKEIFKIRLKNERTMKGFSQEMMAENLGIGRSTYTNWEIGNREPDIENLAKICEILDADLNWLVGLEKNERKQKK